ncbi:glycosyltransferase [Paenibacillus sp. P96]|uniref:4,4'-diaponeurosporenoate glycosyltransferase n=1 Tax=Paenibacillus zeirhizosphaerae TaxID=2987519 RepID=A0ABT9FUR5_9BACL|nr:glycosyltransferase family 2 protein [Paenibacillus sp. P96]MDP4098479.1 glycosyltransferase [Paenibacillus sp. P96]
MKKTQRRFIRTKKSASASAKRNGRGLPRQGVRPLVSVIIPAMNESRTIGRVVHEAQHASHPVEVIVVDNGSEDNSAALAAAAGAKVIRYAEPLGHDVGRRIGAAAAEGEVLLFLDADMVISAAELQPFIEAILQGADVALNSYSGPVDRNPIHRVVEAKFMLNILLARPDLMGASLMAVPHALSRKAAHILGEALGQPPLAHAMAIVTGLNVRTAAAIPVGKLNVKRWSGSYDPLEDLVLEDHVQAICWLTDQLGPRAGFSDLGRRKSAVGGIP